MSKVCEICGKKPLYGKTIVRLRYIPAENAKSDVVVYGVKGLNR